jgi:hypothetical protein
MKIKININSFLCVFSSNGIDKGFKAIDGEIFDLTSEIFEILSGQNSLVGKSNLFFIDACRGDKIMKAIQSTDSTLRERPK